MCPHVRHVKIRNAGEAIRRSCRPARTLQMAYTVTVGRRSKRGHSAGYRAGQHERGWSTVEGKRNAKRRTIEPDTKHMTVAGSQRINGRKNSTIAVATVEPTDVPANVLRGEPLSCHSSAPPKIAPRHKRASAENWDGAGHGTWMCSRRRFVLPLDACFPIDLERRI